jgi:hypothetical protein
MSGEVYGNCGRRTCRNDDTRSRRRNPEYRREVLADITIRGHADRKGEDVSGIMRLRDRL